MRYLTNVSPYIGNCFFTKKIIEGNEKLNEQEETYFKLAVEWS